MISHRIKKENLIEVLKEYGHYCERDVRSAIYFSSLKNKKEIERPEFVLDTLGRIMIFQFMYVVVLESEEWGDDYGIVCGDSNNMQNNAKKFNKLCGGMRDYLTNSENMKKYISYITLDRDDSQFSKIRAIFHQNFYC